MYTCVKSRTNIAGGLMFALVHLGTQRGLLRQRTANAT